MKTWRIGVLAVGVVALSIGVGAPAQADGAAVAVRKKVLVELREQGGFAGLQDRVVVYTNGCVRLSRRTGPVIDKCLTGAEWRGLRGSLKQLKLGKDEAQPQGADFLKYTLTYRGRHVSRYTLTQTWSPVVRRMEKVLQKYWAPD
ncbi:hypothetical protein [Nonomuraea sediminis]|uniref:hypothetical protein n=1 Tax=Nonomuraea sediminis TaxID=2835864 RepID=UPI001BDD2F53|nr:hypothetical protein [Nonomuraea sediminis]